MPFYTRKAGSNWPLVVIIALTLAAWLIGFGVLAARPAATLGAAEGLYAVQGGDATPYRWTSNRVRIPIHGAGGPTSVTLTLGPSTWPGRAAPAVALAGDGGALATFTAPDHVRRYHILLSPAAASLTLETAVDRPPGGDQRWLGVTVYGLEATASGLPLPAAAQALVPALGVLLLALAAVWSMRHGLLVEFALTLLALALRVALLPSAPAGWRTDEVVSLVDAWNLSRTARDHLGHLLPLGAQEALGDWISPLLTYLELPLVAIFGPQRLIGRAVTAMFGALAAPLCYRLARALRLPIPAAVVAGLVAALSPWQIFLSRNALPPALVPTSWAACLLAALFFLRQAPETGRGAERRAALVLAGVAGLALYSYPTMKLAVPLLVAVTVALALVRFGWRAAARWLPATLLLALLWLPFVYVTLFVPASSTRLDQTALEADSWGAWLAAWWNGYSVYFRPEFYYAAGDGSPIRGVPGYGAELLASAPLVVLGLIALVLGMRDWRLGIRDRHKHRSPISHPQSPIPNPQPPIAYLLLAAAVMIAPLPASLTQPSPHSYRAATIAPLYALLAGMGAALLWRLLERVANLRLRRAAQVAGASVLGVALAWQAGVWFRDYTQGYPPQRAWENQDGLLDAMTRAVALAPRYDEVWISYDDINEPYIYLLAARPMPPAEAQARIAVTRRPGHLNDITSVGSFKFVSMADVPRELPAIEAVPDHFGGPAFVLQVWERDGKRILILRRMD
jgi:hypothetical protein